ncbi:PLP-dependent aminotransferase family protein [Bailinhaonella thermotolerans]|uniref:PLP-dependent aminotransferase family protein n=1 Tax=Bailinhaonella thermotolerans TaxID=1070861 RepID=A0A3A4ATN3_9ACTN|nr:PLP-dependent aminotransferase family protein [Bailinhaonella thermotolerans]RJL33350.1 PLP-dependent aminotransferase family protein [Bailinhaonella thermotolerans]
MSDLHLPLDRSRGRVAAQVSSALRDAVRQGRLAPGVRLPATRELARDLGVSRGVVVEAYEQLVAEGFLVSRRGAGTFAADARGVPAPPEPRPGPAVAELSGPVAPRFDLRAGAPDLAAFPRREWLAATRHVLATLPHTELGYGDPGGAPAPRAELAAYLRRVRAADVTPDRLVIVGGVAQGLYLALRVLIAGYGAALAVEDPTSVRSLPLIRAAGADPVAVPVDADGVDVAALRRTGARLALVTPAHQYPTGVVLSPARRAALVAWARDVDGLILEDDYDAEFRYDTEPVGCVQGLAPDRVVLLGSVSKSLAPALRLGWLAGPPAVADAVRRARADSDLGSPALDQHVLARLIASGAHDRHLRRMRRTYRSRRDALTAALAEHLPAWRVHGVPAGLQLYVELPPGSDEHEIVTRARARGVALDPVTPTRVTHPGPPALMLGFTRHPAPHLRAAARALTRALPP